MVYFFLFISMLRKIFVELVLPFNMFYILTFIKLLIKTKMMLINYTPVPKEKRVNCFPLVCLFVCPFVLLFVCP